MSVTFNGCWNFNADLSEWDVSKVTDMSVTFNGCWNFNADLSEWDVSKVGDMDEMFNDCKAFNADLSKWDVSKVLAMQGMFSGAKAFDGRLSAEMVAKMYACGDRRPGRLLWKMARRLALPLARMRCVAYFWFELAARPGPNGEAPPGAIEAFVAEF